MSTKPRIICHMMTTLDGKITGPFMDTNTAELVRGEYERINELYKPDAWLCGRVTTDENFTFYKKPDLDETVSEVPQGDYIAKDNAEMYYVSVDASGRIGWESNTLNYADRPSAHIIEIFTEKASMAYRAFLRRLQISYIIAGEESLDCTLASQKLKELLNINTLLVSGGGYINASFLNEGLIDELSLVIVPVTDCASDTVTLFERADCLPKKSPVEFTLENIEKLKGDGIWLRYSIKK